MASYRELETLLKIKKSVENTSVYSNYNNRTTIRCYLINETQYVDEDVLIFYNMEIEDKVAYLIKRFDEYRVVYLLSNFEFHGEPRRLSPWTMINIPGYKIINFTKP